MEKKFTADEPACKKDYVVPEMKVEALRARTTVKLLGETLEHLGADLRVGDLTPFESEICSYAVAAREELFRQSDLRVEIVLVDPA